MIPKDRYSNYTIDGGRLSHAYIAPGGAADRLAMAAVCSGAGARPCMACAHCGKSSRGVHPDIIAVERTEGKREITVDQIRRLKRDVVVAPNEAEKKAYIIIGAELMNDNAQNALLRILEEPPAHVVFVLKTGAPRELLPTVRSRCVEVKAAAGEPEDDGEGAALADEFFAALGRGNAEIARIMFRLEKLDRDKFSGFLTEARGQAGAAMRRAAAEGDMQTCGAMSQAERTLSKAVMFLERNVSSGHISALICAGLMTEVSLP